MSNNVTDESIFLLLELYFPAFSRKYFLKEATPFEKAQWLYMLVYQSRFELASHFLFGPYSNYMKSGEEFIQGLSSGQGGVCLERVLALKFLLEFFDVGKCSFAMGGSLPGTHEPIDITSVEINLQDPEKKQISQYAHHAAIILQIYDKEWLLDPNGGRLGMIFLNPSLTKQILSNDTEEKLGVAASFGQMFYHRVPDYLFDLLVNYRRGTALETLDLICLVGLLVGPNYDIFIIPKPEIENRIPMLYARRVQTHCWQVRGNVLEETENQGLTFDKKPGEDLFIEK